MIRRKLLLLLKKLYFLKYRLRERTFENRIKYLYFNRGSRVLAVVFSCMDTDDKNRIYNYVKGLVDVKVDLLYLSDPFGYRGSYYWKDKGNDQPLHMTQRLLKKIIGSKQYDCTCFLGSSKGGSAAILHGALLGADYILAGSNQYNIGSYVAQSPDIFFGMTGEKVNKEAETRLNDEFASYFDMIPDKTRLLIQYSINEVTYKHDTIDMLAHIKRNGVNCSETKCDFSLHDEVGSYFKPWVHNYLVSLKKQYDHS